MKHILKTNASAVDRVNNNGIDTKYFFPFLLSVNKQKIICSFAQHCERGMFLLLKCDKLIK